MQVHLLQQLKLRVFIEYYFADHIAFNSMVTVSKRNRFDEVYYITQLQIWASYSVSSRNAKG